MPGLSVSELTSVVSVAIVVVTFLLGRVSVSKTSSAKEQQTVDKLDVLVSDTREIKSGIKEMNRKLDDHTERITKIEVSLSEKASRESVSTIRQQVESLEKRVGRVEGACDLHRGIGSTD